MARVPFQKPINGDGLFVVLINCNTAYQNLRGGGAGAAKPPPQIFFWRAFALQTSRQNADCVSPAYDTTKPPAHRRGPSRVTPIALPSHRPLRLHALETRPAARLVHLQPAHHNRRGVEGRR